MALRRTRRTHPPTSMPVGAASQILHVHPNTLRKWSDQGLIPSYRIGQRRDRRFTEEDLVSFLERSGNGTEEQQGAPEEPGDVIRSVWAPWGGTCWQRAAPSTL